MIKVEHNAYQREWNKRNPEKRKAYNEKTRENFKKKYLWGTYKIT